MAGDVVQKSSGPGKQRGRRRKIRTAIRLDMTPMVDIAFLLLLLPPEPNTPESPQYALWSDSLRGLLMFENRANPKLSTVLKINRRASYRSLVDILDEIDLIERQWNGWLALKLGQEVAELTKADGRFSYRYAIGEWEDGDSRIIHDARNLKTKEVSDGI